MSLRRSAIFIALHFRSLLFIGITSGVFLLLMRLFRLRSVSFASTGGSYISFIIVLGMIFRCYSSGLFNPSSSSYVDQRHFELLKQTGNTMIVFGFGLTLTGIIGIIINTPIMIFFIRKAYKVRKEKMIFISSDFRWSSYRCWSKEWKIILLISFFAIAVEYVNLCNGGSVPFGVL